MSKIVVVSQVAKIAKKMDRSPGSGTKSLSVEASNLAETGLKNIYSQHNLEDEGSAAGSSVKSEVTDMRSVHTKILNETLDDTNKMKLLQLLEDWEEPESQASGIVSTSFRSIASYCLVLVPTN
jgi:hypothetical protein